MREVFIEETAENGDLKKEKTKYTVISILSVLSFVFSGLWLFLFFFCIPMQAFGENTALMVVGALVPTGLFIATGLYLYFFKYKYCNDFDYTFVSGSLRIARVIKNVRRKKVAEFEYNSIQKIGYVDSEEYNRIVNDPEISVFRCTKNKTAKDSKKMYYIYAVLNAEKAVFIIECTPIFIANIISFTGKVAIEKDFK